MNISERKLQNMTKYSSSYIEECFINLQPEITSINNLNTRVRIA
jgi:hypothetical protein